MKYNRYILRHYKLLKSAELYFFKAVCYLFALRIRYDSVIILLK